MSRILNAFQHGIRLPPGDVVIVVKVGQEVGWMGQVFHTSVADVARLLWALGACLRAEFAWTVQATRVGRLHLAVESGVHEVGNASLRRKQKGYKT